MRAFVGRWSDGYLDAHRLPREYRIDVSVWVLLGPVRDQYIVPERRLNVLRNYTLRLGPAAVIRKVKSRLMEAGRNQKFVSAGLGVVIEAPQGASLEPGRQVLFVACNHPRCLERVTAHESLVMEWTGTEPSAGSAELRFFDATGDNESSAASEAVAGWSPYSGDRLDTEAVRAIHSSTAKRLEQWSQSLPASSTLLPKSAEKASEREEVDRSADGTIEAVLFGFGNYAKTQILPHVDSRIRVKCIHEIDPVQLRTAAGLGVSLDTAPAPRTAERYDAWFIAGYHHTHADVAVAALKQGSYAVVEKPLATDRRQLQALTQELQASSGKFFACFHKRYSKSIEWINQDLGQGKDAPVCLHALVFEIPLPARHWYTWATSRGRLVSNGCHWIDYFLYLNGFAPVRDLSASRAGNGDITVRIELWNEAVFSMCLTDVGSTRVGVREHLEIRARNRMIRITDEARYEAEDNSRILRRQRLHPLDAHRRMYQRISSQICAGGAGDPVESLLSADVVLQLEEMAGGREPLGETRPLDSFHR